MSISSQHINRNARSKRANASQRSGAKRTPFFSPERPFFTPDIQPKLTVNAPNDIYEKEADVVADQVMRMPDPQLQRQSAAPEEEEMLQMQSIEEDEEMMLKTQPPTVQRACAECEKEGLQRKPLAGNIPPFFQRKETGGGVPKQVASSLQSGSGGQPLPDNTRGWMESRFGADFSGVKIHTGSHATQLNRQLNAQAFTHGRNIYFNEGKYRPETNNGKRLIAHELTHTTQQKGIRRKHANAIEPKTEPTPHGPGYSSSKASFPRSVLQRQSVTPLGPGGGFGGLMERDRLAAGPGGPGSGTPFQVCSRSLQGALGLVGNHAYIEAPPFRYAIISPLCPASWHDNPVTGTTAQKWDNSPDPCGKQPNCVPCHPAPGVTDVGTCLRSAFGGYNHPSLYKGLGPNSNTFAGTLARRCCAGMVPKPSALGNVPGWSDPPAPSRAGASPCPPGPVC